MSKTKLKESSRRFLRILRLSIISFVCMGILIGYHGAPLINSLIGVFWFMFAVTAGMVVLSALTTNTENQQRAISGINKSFDEIGPACCEQLMENRRKARTERRQKVSSSV